MSDVRVIENRFLKLRYDHAVDPKDVVADEIGVRHKRTGQTWLGAKLVPSSTGIISSVGMMDLYTLFPIDDSGTLDQDMA